MKKLWHSILEWFEYGDLVPLIVLVSAVHYAVILRGHDIWPVAIAIGILVDLGHYRWTRAAVRYSGNNQREKAIRWSLALLMTAISLAYQQRYYDDWWYAIPLPLLIISLAWLSEADKAKQHTSQSASKRILTDVETTPAVESEPEAETFRYICGVCGHGCDTQNGLNAHQRKHKQDVPDIAGKNGHKQTKQEAR